MVNLNKPLLYCGNPVRVICTDRLSPLGLTLVVMETRQNSISGDWEETIYIDPNDVRLTNAREERSAFTNLYCEKVGVIFDTLERAEAGSYPLYRLVGFLEIITDANTGEFIRTVVHPVQESK